jgi:hypothetical protein
MTPDEEIFFELQRASARAEAHGLCTLGKLPTGEPFIIVRQLTRAANDEQTPVYVRIQAAARLIDTSIGVLRTAIRRGELQQYGRQRDRTVRRDALLQWAEARRAAPSVATDDERIIERTARLIRARAAKVAHGRGAT